MFGAGCPRTLVECCAQRLATRAAGHAAGLAVSIAQYFAHSFLVRGLAVRPGRGGAGCRGPLVAASFPGQWGPGAQLASCRRRRRQRASRCPAPPRAICRRDACFRPSRLCGAVRAVPCCCCELGPRALAEPWPPSCSHSSCCGLRKARAAPVLFTAGKSMRETPRLRAHTSEPPRAARRCTISIGTLLGSTHIT